MKKHKKERKPLDLEGLNVELLSLEAESAAIELGILGEELREKEEPKRVFREESLFISR